MTLSALVDALRHPRKPRSAAFVADPPTDTCEPVPEPLRAAEPVPGRSRRCWCCGWPTPTGFCPTTCRGPRLVDGPQDLKEQVEQEYRARTERGAA